jgi:hypothetical protein
MRRIFRDSTLALAFISASLFLLGWFYLYGFYEYFDLDFQTLDLPTYTTLIFAGIPIVHVIAKLIPVVSLGFFMFLAGYLLGATPLGRRLRSKVRWHRPAGAPTMENDKGITVGVQPEPLPTPAAKGKFFQRSLAKLPEPLAVVLCGELLLGLIVGAHGLGRKDAQSQYQDPSSKVHLNFKKDEEKAFDETLVAANKRDDLRLLAQTKDLVIVFVQGKIEEGVFIVPQANLLSVHNKPISRNK